jgi:putative flippase GtrA
MLSHVVEYITKLKYNKLVKKCFCLDGIFMLDFIKSRLKFFKYCMVGGLNTLVNWALFYVFESRGMNYLVANVIAYLIATIHSFIWNNFWVFKSSEASFMKAGTKFLIINLIGLSVNAMLMYFFVSISNLNEYVALVITTAIVLFFNYFGNKLWTFKSSKAE